MYIVILTLVLCNGVMVAYKTKAFEFMHSNYVIEYKMFLLLNTCLDICKYFLLYRDIETKYLIYIM